MKNIWSCFPAGKSMLNKRQNFLKKHDLLLFLTNAILNDWEIMWKLLFCSSHIKLQKFYVFWATSSLAFSWLHIEDLP